MKLYKKTDKTLEEIDLRKRVVDNIAAPKMWNFLESEKLFKSSGKPDLDALREHLSGEGFLQEKDAIRIIRDAKKILRKEKNVVKIEEPIVICGDIHGQFYDLLHIFKIGGNPTDTRYIFLGDFVDRGNFGTECVFMLLSCKILNSNGFFLLRGNHECRLLTKFYNFKRECLFKYNDKVYNEMLACFDCLPLAAIISGKILCTHGGISPKLVKITDLDKIDRFREPPPNGLFNDILWSDPMSEEKEKECEKDFVFNEQRECSFSYSIRGLKKFLDDNNLISLFRSHSPQDRGFKLYKQNKKEAFPCLITIFSAPNYCNDLYKNKGAIMIYKDSNIDIKQFEGQRQPYVLPHFVNAFNWSMPFVLNNIQDIFYQIISISIEEHKKKRSIFHVYKKKILNTVNGKEEKEEKRPKPKKKGTTKKRGGNKGKNNVVKRAKERKKKARRFSLSDKNLFFIYDEKK